MKFEAIDNVVAVVVTEIEVEATVVVVVVEAVAGNMELNLEH